MQLARTYSKNRPFAQMPRRGMSRHLHLGKGCKGSRRGLIAHYLTLRKSKIYGSLGPMTLHDSGHSPDPDSASLSDRNHLEDQELKDLFSLLFKELHQRARNSMGVVAQAHTLQPTALIGEAYIRIQKSGPNRWDNHDHFLKTASRAMRCVLVDHYRSKHTIKRSKQRADIEVDMIAEVFEKRAGNLHALDLALKKLETTHPEMAQAVQLRFFGGVEMGEVARILDIPLRTLERRWTTVKSWLKAELS